MIVFDVETTGLLKPSIVDLNYQPQIIEFAAVKLDDNTLEQKDSISFLVNPKCKIPEHITRLTGITTDMTVDAMTFDYHFSSLVNFFLGEKHTVAHNIAFDLGVLNVELKRIGKDTKFPYPPVQICTVNQTFNFKQYKLNLGALYSHLFGDGFKEAHRASDDVAALAKCVRRLITDNVIKIA